jgi:hypothetical protein
MIAGYAMVSAIAQNSIEPMVTASWHQSKPFNEECPGKAAAGCGAIAVSQIMNYYKKPAHGFGRATYGNVDVDYEGRVIDWNNIVDNYNGITSTEQKNAVASLVYQVGAAMHTSYGSSSSIVSLPARMMWGLQHYLHFSPKSRYRRRLYYSTTEWIEMLNKELEKGCPVFYRGDHTEPNKDMIGHMFIIDGHDSEGRYHFNFGNYHEEQDKYTDLNIINQGKGIWPGVYSVSYHHRQAMTTDFYIEDGLTDSDYDKSAIVLSTPIVLEKQPDAKNIIAKERVFVRFTFNYANFIADSCYFSLGFYQDGELVAVSKTVRHPYISVGGNSVNVGRNFTLPDHLADGDYEMSIISRDDENSPWVRGWDNAPNRVPVTVKDNVYTFTMPNYHTLETRLYLEDGSINEVSGITTNGKVLEMTVCNPSDNNFEDSLRLVVTAKGVTRQYDMVTSIYDGQKITYRFLVANNEIDTSNGYTAVAYYKEVNTGEWLQLADQAAGVSPTIYSTFDGVEIYTVGGVLQKRIGRENLEVSYSYVLAQLPKGIYIIRDKAGQRIFIKRV